LSTALVLMGGLFWATSPARAWDAEKRPAKYLNLKLGAGFETQHRSADAPYCTSANRALGQVGLQTGFFPWTAEVAFYTNVAIEFHGGFFWPARRLWWGWLTFSAGPALKMTREEFMKDKDAGCEGEIMHDMDTSVGVGATAEFLLYEGHLGFFVEARQYFLEPVATTIFAGINVSPLLWVLFRNQ